MRGKVEQREQMQISIRITPAYAGKSCRPHSNIIVLGDHPRLCGEKQFIRHPLEHELGSPPPMRGKDHEKSMGNLQNRITPAYAGKRIPTTTARVPRRDHPRLCGEKMMNGQTPIFSQGSPPPMRGKVPYAGKICLYVGITPAYAGKSI